MQYPKINNLYKRVTDGPDKGRIMIGKYSELEFEAIDKWIYTEKIDGTNTRIYYNSEDSSVIILGKGDKSIFPPGLKEYLGKLFTVEKLSSVFPDGGKIIFYGESFGKGIQEPCGSKYNPNGYYFMLFDILMIDDVDDQYEWWLEFDNVQDIGDKLCIDTVPLIGVGDKEEIFDYVRNEYKSRISDQTIEGVVATSYPMMYYRKSKTPIRFKLKVKDVKRAIT